MVQKQRYSPLWGLVFFGEKWLRDAEQGSTPRGKRHVGKSKGVWSRNITLLWDAVRERRVTCLINLPGGGDVSWGWTLKETFYSATKSIFAQYSKHTKSQNKRLLPINQSRTPWLQLEVFSYSSFYILTGIIILLIMYIYSCTYEYI